MKGDMLTAGAMALRKCGRTQAEIARELGATRQLVYKWWAGVKLPGPEYRARLDALGLVRADQWEQSGSRRALVAPPPTTSAPATDVRVSTRDELEAQVSRLRGRLGDSSLSPSAAVQVERALGQALASLAKLDGAQISEVMILRHPAWLRVQTIVLAALEPYPDALCAVSDALKAAGG